MTTMTLTEVALDGLLAAGAVDLDQHLRCHGAWPRLDSTQIIATVADAALTGRGGAGFPTARKLAAVASAPGTPVVVANGAEGEPLSGKDEHLLRNAPHLVLDGVQLAARAVGARRAYLYARGRTSSDAVRRALAERAGAALDPVPVEVVTASGAFVAGQESAVVAAVQGRAAVPSGSSLRVTQRGVGGRPTLVQNVETLAHLALVARRGAAWYRSLGVRDDPGTFLATVGGAVRSPGVIEAEHGTPLVALLDAAGGPAVPLQAVLLGGYSGTWLRWPEHAGIPLARPALRALGADLGAGVIIALPARECPLTFGAGIAQFLADASARQCGPCLNALPRTADLLARLASGDRSAGLPEEIARVVGLARGACAHPDGAARFVRSTLGVFADDVRAHLAGDCIARGAR